MSDDGGLCLIPTSQLPTWLIQLNFYVLANSVLFCSIFLVYSVYSVLNEETNILRTVVIRAYIIRHHTSLPMSHNGHFTGSLVPEGITTTTPV